MTGSKVLRLFHALRRQWRGLTFSAWSCLWAQREWSFAQFGSGRRTLATVSHIEMELDEIRENPDSLEEWVDVILLAIDGALRTGAYPSELICALRDKQHQNIHHRAWLDAGDDQPAVRIRSMAGGSREPRQ